MSHRSILILIAIVAGCASAEKRYEQAQQAEAEERWAAAAGLYIDALRRDAEYPGARDGLRASGDRAVAIYSSTARKFEDAGRYEQAVKEFKSADALIQRASTVRIVLEVPADYTTRRGAAYARAMEQALAAADRELAADRFEQAAGAYQRALESFQPDAKQRVRAQDGQYRALLAAAEEFRGEGHFQDAFTLVQRALDVYGSDASASARARALHDQVVAEGTVRVAAVPMWRTERAVRQLPAGFLDEVNDLLEDGPWSHPPPFVACLEAKEVREALRALGVDRRGITDDQAAEAGRHVNADYAVVASVRRFVVGAGKQQPQVVEVATRDGEGAEILVHSLRTLTVGCEFRLVRVADRSVVAEKTVHADAERRMRYAVKKGDARDLLLTEEQHRLLDRRRLAEADRSLEKDVAAALAEVIGEEVYKELLERLP